MRSKLLATTIVAMVGAVVWTEGSWAQAANDSSRPDKEISQENGSATKAPTRQMERKKQRETGQTGQAQITPEPPMKPKGDESAKSSAGTGAQGEKKTDQNAQPAGSGEKKSAGGQASGKQESQGATGAQAEKKTNENAQPATGNRAGQASGKPEGSGAMRPKKGSKTSTGAPTETRSGENARAGKTAQPRSAEENGASSAGTATLQQGETANGRGERRPVGSSNAGKSEPNVAVTGNVHISRENASRVAKALMSTAPEPRSMNVDVEVGAPLPGNLELRALPPEIASLVPEYRGFEYVAAGDEIVIVQPSTRNVVEIIRQGRMAQAPEEPSRLARIDLSDAQRRMLIDSIREEKLPEAQIAELSDGDTIPQDIDLEPLPSTIFVQIPMIERYGVLVAPGDRVVLVDPETRAVIDIVE